MRAFSSLTTKEVFAIAKILQPVRFNEKLYSQSKWKEIVALNGQRCLIDENEEDAETGITFMVDELMEEIKVRNPVNAEHASIWWEVLKYLWGIGINPNWCLMPTKKADEMYAFIWINAYRLLSQQQLLCMMKELAESLPHPEVLAYCKEYVAKFDHENPEKTYP